MSASGSQSGRGSSSGYFDPEAPDLSEQEFAASLDSVPDRPRFIVDAAQVSPAAPGISSVLSPEREAATDGVRSLNEEVGRDIPALEAKEDDPAPVANSDWREQVSAKVSKYKTATRHKVRYPSLQLPFEPGPYPAKSWAAEVSQTFSEPAPAETVKLQPSDWPEPRPPRISFEATARVLEFPRIAPPSIDPDALAEPLLDRPRIVEAPELLPAPPAMGRITIETPTRPEPERRPGFDMPLKSAPLSVRLWAGGIDTLLIGIAVATFAYSFVRITGSALPAQMLWKSAATLFALLWPAYEYVFLVYSETTPGLNLAKLELQRFDGTPVPRSLRRWRVLASLLSAVSLGLGYAWCFLDEDQLSWHDRITRTHLAPQTKR